MSQLIAANWKMNGLFGDSRKLVKGISQHLQKNNKSSSKILICPPFPLISSLIEFYENKNLHIGAQDCHWELNGAHTGDISPELLANLGCSHVILGHSERRVNHFESNEIVNKKAKSAISCNLDPIICIGETQEERNSGQMEVVIKEQVTSSIINLPIEKQLIIAYEPIWAIGTGIIPSSEQIIDAHAFINEIISSIGFKDSLILYGGSVKPSNAKEILSLKGVDGALVGGASLNLSDFLQIIGSSV